MESKPPLEGAKGQRTERDGSLQATSYKRKMAQGFFFPPSSPERKLTQKLGTRSHASTKFSPEKAIPFATLLLFLFLDFFATIDHLRIMLSTIFALKKKYYDDLADYDKGRIHGIMVAHAYLFAFSMACELYGAYKGRR